MKAARITTLAVAALALGTGALVARAVARAPRWERMLPPSPATAEHLKGMVAGADLRRPAREEARAAVARAFGTAVEPVDATAVASDFNGDGSPDLAILVVPAPGREPAVLAEVANWTVQRCPGAAPEDVLLAVVHGAGARGWRDPDARQAYLVQGAPRGLAAAEVGRLVRWTGARYACAPANTPSGATGHGRTGR